MALFEIILLAFTLASAILLSPEPLVVRFPGTAQQLYLAAAPQFARELIFGIGVGEYGEGGNKVPMQYWLGRDKNALPFAEIAKEKAHQAAEEITHAADSVVEAMQMAQRAALAGRDRIHEAQASTWNRAIEHANKAKEKARDMVATAEGRASHLAESAFKSIMNPTLASLEAMSRTAEAAKYRAGQVVESVKENVQHGVESVQEVGKQLGEGIHGVGESIYSAVGEMNDKVKETGHAAWEKVARVGEATWHLEENARKGAIRAGHSFWNGICATEDMAVQKFCQAEDAARRAASTVYERGSAVMRCIKHEAFRPEERKALAGKVQWCEDVVEDYVEKASTSTGDFFKVLEDSAKEARSGSDHGGTTKERNLLEPTEEGWEIAEDASEEFSHRTSEAAEMADRFTKPGVSDAVEEVSHRVRETLGEVAEGSQEAYDMAKEGMAYVSERGKETIREFPGDKVTNIEQKAKDVSKEKWDEASDRAKETWLDLRNSWKLSDLEAEKIEEVWGYVNAARTEGKGPVKWSRDIGHPFLWVGLQRLVHLASFSIAFGAVLFLVFYGRPSFVDRPIQDMELAKNRLSLKISQISAICVAICLGIAVQSWLLRPSNASNKWQVCALAIALLASATNSIVLLPWIQKVRKEWGETSESFRDEPGSSNTVGSDQDGADKEGDVDRSKPGYFAEQRSSKTGTADLGVVEEYWSREMARYLTQAWRVATWFALVGLVWHLWHLSCRLLL